MTVVAQRRRAQPERRAVTPEPEERPMWQFVALLYGTIFVLAVFLTALCFLSAYLVTGRAY